MVGRAMVDAAARGRTPRVKSVLRVLAGWDDRQTWLTLAFCAAAREQKAEAVRVLIAAGADVHWDRDITLRWAVRFGHDDIAQIILAHIFAPEQWMGKSRADIEGEAWSLYKKIKAGDALQDGLGARVLEKARVIIVDHSMTCWERVRPAGPVIGMVSPAKGNPV
jgi:hypothetical protein